MSPQVRFEPIGEEIDCAPDETVLDAAFRHGYNLVYGCREGQCSACKCFLLEGDVALKRYSNFALSDSERSNGYSLMCRAMPEQDLVVELLHYDPEGYRLEHPIRDGSAIVEAVEPLTDDIVRVRLRVDDGFDFTPGQYVDLHVDGERRSFSMANADRDRIELIVKRYPGGRFSGKLDGELKPGDQIGFTGPYGSMRIRNSDRPILMIAGGSGLAPILSLLHQLSASGSRRPVRFFFGAQTMFCAEEIAAVELDDFGFVPVSDRFVHEAVDEFLAATESFVGCEVYMCGPPPMIEAAEEMLVGKYKLDEQRIFSDKFTTSADAVSSADPAPPVKRVDGGAPARGDEADRAFAWFTPQGRRATLYEDVTVDTQPSIYRHLTRGWPLSFEDGRGTWDERSTTLRCQDWFAFRDPGEQWERPYYQAGTAVEHQIEGAVRSAEEEGLFADFSPEWTDFLRDVLQVPAYVEHGLWFALATVARDCLSDSVATCVCLQAAQKQRSAQSIVLYAMDLERHHGEFPIEAAREAFVGDPVWQPARRYLERLAATSDWGEVAVAANLCFEPVVGTLLRRELGIRTAAANGDIVTPVLAQVATQEWEWVRAWSTALVRFVCADAVNGAANREVVAGWVREWLPEAVAAAAALAPLAERVPRGIDLEQALERIRSYAGAVLAEAELGELAELLGAEVPVVAPMVPAATETPATRRTRGAHGTRVAPGPRVAHGTPARRRVTATGATDDAGTYDYVGIVMAKSAEGDAVAEILGRRDDVEVSDQPAFWDIRAKDRLIIPYADVSEQLGYEIDAYSIQHEMSTHYGRMVASDDALMLFSDPTEAMEYLMS